MFSFFFLIRRKTLLTLTMIDFADNRQMTDGIMYSHLVRQLIHHFIVVLYSNPDSRAMHFPYHLSYEEPTSGANIIFVDIDNCCQNTCLGSLQNLSHFILFF